MKTVSAIFLGILKWTGILILGLLVLLVLVMLIPVRFGFVYAEHKFSAELKIAWFTFRFGGKKKDSDETVEQTPEESSEKEEKAAKQSRFEITAGIIWDLLNDAGSVLKWLLKRISILDIDVAVPLNAGDPFLTGSVLGAVWSAAGNVMTLLAKLFGRTEYIRMDFNPVFDPLAEPPAPRAGAVIRGVPLTIAAAGLIIFIKYLKIQNLRNRLHRGTEHKEKEIQNVTEQ